MSQANTARSTSGSRSGVHTHAVRWLSLCLPTGLLGTQLSASSSLRTGLRHTIHQQMAIFANPTPFKLAANTIVVPTALVAPLCRLHPVVPADEAQQGSPQPQPQRSSPSRGLTKTSPPPSELPSAPGSNNNIFGLLVNDDVSDDEVAGAQGGEAKKKKKKKNKKKKGGAGGVAAGGEGEGEGEGEAEGEEAGEAASAPTANGGHAQQQPGQQEEGSDNEPDEGGAGGAEGGGAKKKNKKKKKKGKGAGAAAVSDGPSGEAQGGDAAEVEREEAQLPQRSPSPPAPDTAASTSPSGPLSKAASRAISVNVAVDFAAEPTGGYNLQVGRGVDHDPLLGPAVHHALGKVSVKGEDRWLEVGCWEGWWGCARPEGCEGGTEPDREREGRLGAIWRVVEGRSQGEWLPNRLGV